MAAALWLLLQPTLLGHGGAGATAGPSCYNQSAEETKATPISATSFPFT